MDPSFKIRPLESQDFPQWLRLWDGNNLGLRDEKITASTWARLMDPHMQIFGLGALIPSPSIPLPEGRGKRGGAEQGEGETMIGLVHYILHPTTGAIEPACYMQDVYVAPEYRQKGAARALVREVAEIGRKARWSRLYWLAESDNIPAQNLYKNLGVKLDFTLHVMPLSPLSP